MPFAIGVDIGGSSAKLGVVNEVGEIGYRHTVITPTTNSPEQAAAEYAQGIQQLLDRCALPPAQLVGIGVGMPGHISQDRRVSTVSNVPILDNFPLTDFFHDRFKLPVQLDNDATLAALAESRFGAGRQVDRLLVVTVGTGIGVGLIIGGEPQRFTRGCLGDSGHLIVEPEGRWRCRLGCQGCLETVASSLALEREATAVAQWLPESPLGARLSAQGKLTTADVIQAAQAGDAEAGRLIEQIGYWLGLGLVSYCYLFDPDLILIGGGLSAAEGLLLAPLRQTMLNVGMPTYTTKTTLALAQFGNEAGLIGAASLVLNRA